MKNVDFFESKTYSKRRDRKNNNRNESSFIKSKKKMDEAAPKMVILKHENNNASDPGEGGSRIKSPVPSTQSLGPERPVRIAQSQVDGNQSSSAVTPIANSNPLTYESLLKDKPASSMTGIINLIDESTWKFDDNGLTEKLFNDLPSPAAAYQVIGVLGKQSVGKSRLLNKLAGKSVFKTHFSEGVEESLLKHVTRGVDLHITKERLFLLDTQPLLSASVLDEYLIKLGHSYMPYALQDPETFVNVTSLQIVTFIMNTCDHVIIVNDWAIDLHLIKLITTAQMLMGNAQNKPQAEIIFYLPKQTQADHQKLSSSLQAMLGKFTILYEDDENDHKEKKDDTFLCNIFRLCARRKAMMQEDTKNGLNEVTWLANAQKCWKSLIQKSSIIEYGYFLPKALYTTFPQFR